MKINVGVVGLYVRDQDEALQFYVEKQSLREIVAKGAMPCWCSSSTTAAPPATGCARGVELTQEPLDRYGTVDAGFRDPSGNGWKRIEARRDPG